MNSQKILKLNNYIFTFVTLITFYGFGTFGFFNIYGLAVFIKIFVLLYCVFGVLVILQKWHHIKNEKFFWLFIFFITYYGFASTFITLNINTGFIQSFVVIIVGTFIYSLNEEDLNFLIKLLLFFTFIITVAGIIAFSYYNFFGFNPPWSNLDNRSITLMNSDIGNKKIDPIKWMDYFSFTNGATYRIGDSNIMRMQGFSNEASSTVVHYLAPAVISFLIYRKAIFIGLLGILFSTVCTGSVLITIPILLAPLIYILLNYLTLKSFQMLFYLFLLIVVFSLFQISTLMNYFGILGEYLYSNFGIGIIKDKIVDDNAVGNDVFLKGSIYWRIYSFKDGISSILNYPLGFSPKITMTGLWLQITLIGGFFLLFIYLLFLNLIVKSSIILFKKTSNFTQRFGISLILSIIIVATLLNNYGWDRIPGAMMLIIYYKILSKKYFYN